MKPFGDEEMSVEAKERYFAKNRSFTEQQTEWIESFKDLTMRLSRDHQMTQRLRGILIHIKLQAPELSTWGKLRRETAQILVGRPTLVQAFQDVLRTVKTTFPGDDQLYRKVRELAQNQQLTTEEILAAHRRKV